MIALLLLLVGCAAPDICEEAPTVTWDNFAAGFVSENCQSCHASTSTDRNYAPENVTFDTEEELWAHAPDVLGVATGENPFMPPQGGVSEDDRYQLEVMLSCTSSD